MKKLCVLLLAAALAVFGLFSFAACNEETLDPDDSDDPIVTPEPDDPNDSGKPDEPDEPDVHTHNFGEWEVVIEPTCTEEGLRERACACGEKESEEIEALGHMAGETVKENEVAATCTEQGSYDEVVYCTVCKEELSRKTVEIDSLGHDYVNGVCSRCHDTIATEGLKFVLMTTEEGDEIFEEFFGEGFEDFYICTGMTAAEENVVIPSTYNGLPVRMVQWSDLEPEIANGITSLYIPDSVQIVQWSVYETCENLTEIRLPRNPDAMIFGSVYFSSCAFYNDPNNWEGGALYMDDWLLATNDDLPEEYTVKQGTYGIAVGAFMEEGYESHVKKVTVPDGVQSLIGSFYYCTSLEEVVLPDSLSSIGAGAFYGCSSLTSVTIPDGVTSIGYQAFDGCSSLTSIVIPDSVISIGDGAVYDCTGLASITIPESVASIGYSVFSDTAYYNDASNWEDGVLYIGNHLIGAEYNISGNYSVREGTKTIAGGAFEYCRSLTSITIPDSVTSIGSQAFYYCDGLTSITIPDSVTSIGSQAFYYCDGLTSITIPDSVTSIGDWAFYSCDSLASVTIGDGVTSIGAGAFLGCHSLMIITIPNSVTSIGIAAFEDCGSLTSITIPDSVTSIGDGIFFSCSGLTSVTIGDGVTSIGQRAFYECHNLTSINIPDSVTSIGDEAFAGCSSLTSIIVDPQNSVYHSDGNCLIETESKTLIAGCGASVIPAYGSVTSIGGSAFSGCDSLTSIVIPDSVTSIGEYAFSSCDSLTSIVIPDNVTFIGDWAFTYCRNLTSVTIGDGVTSIGEGAFYNCYSLTSITIPDSVISIDNYAFYDCSGLTSVTIPDSVTIIGDEAFRSCSSLTSVTIPDSVTSIGYGAFSSCSALTSVMIGDGVTYIGYRAFSGCSSLETVYYRGSEAEWNEIEIGQNNDDLEDANIIFNYTGE